MRDTSLLVHIEHKEPIEFKNFVSSLNSLNDLYTHFVRNGNYSLGESKSCLYVEKIDKGSIDIKVVLIYSFLIQSWRRFLRLLSNRM